jgi:hypothetical protein
VREINISRAGDPVHAGDKALTQETPVQRRRVNRYDIGICCFFARHAALRKKNKDWVAQNQNNVCEWRDISIRGLLSQ